MGTIEVRGLENLKRIIADIEPKINAVIKEIALQVKGSIAQYPGAPPWSTYRRTGRLAKNWTISRSNLAATIGNNTEYGPFVQDRDRQAWFHQFNNWKTTDDVSEEYDPKLQKMLEDEVQKVLNQ